MKYATIKERIKEIENLELYIQRLSNPRCTLCFTLPNKSTLPINEAFIGKRIMSLKETYIENAKQHLQLLITILESNTKHESNSTSDVPSYLQ